MQREHKSRMRIVRALETMMEITPIDKIQVTKLCETADIGRSTFYDNFQNVYDVALWYWDQLLENTLYTIGQTSTFYEAHLQFFMKIYDERKFFCAAFRPSDYNSINQYGYRTIGAMYIELVKNNLGRDLSKEEEAVMRFFNIGASDYCAEWVRGGMQESPQLMAKTFTDATPSIMACLK